MPDELVNESALSRSMLFEIAMADAERRLTGKSEHDWDQCFKVAVERQRKYYDARIPTELNEIDISIATHASKNLVKMLHCIQRQYPNGELQIGPEVPGLGWIASGRGDFSLGDILIEVKHTDRNFVAGDFRQVLMYWLLKYAASVESDSDVWSHVHLLNPRRNVALLLNVDWLLKSASANMNRVELYELLRSIVGQELDRR